jgi:hypothetical protein
MLTGSVSNIDLYRVWRKSEDLDLEWLLRRLRGEEPQTEQMKAGEAFHKILENPDFTEQTEVTHGDYWFSILCDIEVAIPQVRELSIEKQYGDVIVRGRIDGLRGKTVKDYKTTAQFDPDRLMEGYQWRFYLDMLGCETFTWQVFVLSQYGKPGHYDVTQTHELTQKRYVGMEADCVRLASDYADFIRDCGASAQKTPGDGKSKQVPLASACTAVAQEVSE